VNKKSICVTAVDSKGVINARAMELMRTIEGSFGHFGGREKIVEFVTMIKSPEYGYYFLNENREVSLVAKFPIERLKICPWMVHKYKFDVMTHRKGNTCHWMGYSSINRGQFLKWIEAVDDWTIEFDLGALKKIPGIEITTEFEDLREKKRSVVNGKYK
jgi:hypothetical protein